MFIKDNKHIINMKQFPNILNLNNKNNFPVIYYNRILCYLRRNIYEHIIKEDENNYFDLDTFSIMYKIKDVNIIQNMVNTLIEELNKLGWKCKLSYGETALFIYSSDKPPPSCWEE